MGLLIKLKVRINDGEDGALLPVQEDIKATFTYQDS